MYSIVAVKHTPGVDVVFAPLSDNIRNAYTTGALVSSYSNLGVPYYNYGIMGPQDPILIIN